ncbi:MAG: DUF1829 domain-containing protein [Deltaproteobacteria bacterium]|nr:DUF1829 domain-containing protein [Deltaproteobacteria bacterium]
MTEEQCKSIVDKYLDWMRQELRAQLQGDDCEISTPFLDRHRDQLQIYAISRNGQIVLTDDGYTVSELTTAGIEMDSSAVRQNVEALVKGSRVRFQGNELTTETTPDTIGERVQAFLQAMLALNTLSIIAASRLAIVSSLESDIKERTHFLGPPERSSLPVSAEIFEAGIEYFLAQSGIKHKQAQVLHGRSGLSHSVDFVIPQTEQRPLRYIKLVPKPSRTALRSILLMVLDTQENRPRDSRFYVFLNDAGRKVSGQLLEPLQSYGVGAIRWTEREEYVQELAA